MLEFKIDKGLAGALRRIRESDYAGRFCADGKALVGINFDTEKDNVSE